MSMVLAWNLKPGEKREGWIVRPYHGYAADLPTLRKHDWAAEMAEGKKEWQTLLARLPKPAVPDTGVTNAYQACFCDLFIMREPFSDGRVGGVPGTEIYRAGSSGEAAIVAIALDQNGFHKEAADGCRASLEAQGDDGNWADPKGWMHHMWCASGFKCWTIMEHYRLDRRQGFPGRTLSPHARQLALAGSPACHDASGRRPAPLDLRFDAARVRRLWFEGRRRHVRGVSSPQPLDGLRRSMLVGSGEDPLQEGGCGRIERRYTKRPLRICLRRWIAARSRRRITDGSRACRARRAAVCGGR